jgi:ABC-type transporter lipoprotein component MlaA
MARTLEEKIAVQETRVTKLLAKLTQASKAYTSAVDRYQTTRETYRHEWARLAAMHRKMAQEKRKEGE